MRLLAVILLAAIAVALITASLAMLSPVLTHQGPVNDSLITLSQRL